MANAVRTLVETGRLPFCTDLSDCKTVQEGIKKANLDFTVEPQKLITETCIDTNKYATVRTDTNKILGIVSEKYNILQNIDAFNFFEPFLENEFATLETAGALYNGRQIFVLAKIRGENIQVNDDDTIEKYILLSNSHDHSSSIKVGFTPIRVVCCNMLSFVGQNQASQLIKVHHRGEINITLNQIKETMDLINQQFIATEEQYKELAKRPVNKATLQRYVKQVFSTKKLNDIIMEYENKTLEKEAIEDTRKRLLARVEEIFDLEPVHNAWTAYNSINHYLNHDKSKSIDNRYGSLWFGNSARLDSKALQLAYKI